MAYLNPTDPGAFDDYPKTAKASHLGNDYVECPNCQGHGGWNLALNSYPLHSMPDTAENRHRYSHFRASCSQCHGFGYTNDLDCIHEFSRTRSVGNCMNEYVCKKCNCSRVYDTSG